MKLQLLHRHMLHHLCMYLQLEIKFLEETHSKDRESAGFLFLAEASLHQSLCSLCEHLHNYILQARSNSSDGQSKILHDKMHSKAFAYAFSYC